MSSSSDSPSAIEQVPYQGAKLYYGIQSCAAACFIAAHTAGLKGLELEQVDTSTHKTKSSNRDFYSINAKGNVPTLVLANGVVLNEGGAILQFIADQNPEANLAGAWGTLERYEVQNALNFIASELHPRVGALFGLDEQKKQYLMDRVLPKLELLNKLLAGKKYYLHDRFTVVDAYAYVILTWAHHLEKQGKLNLSGYPNIQSYFQGLAALPNIKEAYKLMAENLPNL